MRRDLLPGPRPANRGPDHAGAAANPEAAFADTGVDPVPARPDAGEEPLAHGLMPAPSRATRRLRVLFDPVTGRVRRLERGLNHLLSRRLYPRLPLVGRIYGEILKRYLTVSDAEIEVSDLPPAFDGTTVLLVSDIHSGPFLPGPVVQHTFERLLTLKPDLIGLAGDFTTSRVSEFVANASAFRSLAAPLGVFGVLGNHDHYTGEPQRMCAEIEACGIRMLHNDSAVVAHDGARIALAGIDDFNAGSPDLDAALEGVPHETCVILLSHNPDVFFDAARRGVSLVLSGHTHGGQIRVPGLGVLARMSRYRLDEGRYHADGSEIVVSRGLGAVGLPVRIACPPEAVLLRLRSGR